jgi:hypothetical protein
VFATDTGAADAAVQRIVAANLGQASVRVVPKQAAPAAAPLAAASAKSPAMLAAVVNATPLPKPALAD